MSREQLQQRVQQAIAGEDDDDDDDTGEPDDDLDTQQTVLFVRPVRGRPADDDPTRS